VTFVNPTDGATIMAYMAQPVGATGGAGGTG
jgi:hypothetical protein